MNWLKRIWRKLFKKEVKPTPIVITPSKPRPSKPRPSKPRPSKPSVLNEGDIGVDISHHNSDVNLRVLADAVDFIYMKATEGTTFVSNVYNERADELRELTTPWGAYHYYKVDSDPLEQANHFLKYIDKSSGLVPVLDIEAINNRYRDKHTAELLIFLERIEEVTGLIPMVYTSYYYARDVIQPTAEFARYPLWIAHYTKTFDNVKCPKPWKEIKVWQHTESGKIKGVVGRVDLNKVMS